MASSFLKDPTALLDYQWDWSGWLAADEIISNIVVTPPTGLTLDITAPHTAGYTATTTTVTAWLAGGTAGTRYPVTCTITTSLGRVDERTIYIQVVDR